MKSLFKIAGCLLLGLGSFTAVKAQNASGNAQQTVKLALAGVMELTFVNTNSQTGNTVSLVFDDVQDYSDGVESSEQNLRVRSNKKFQVHVESATKYFTYTGSATSGNNMKVKDVLKMKVVANNTGGPTTNGFNNYKSIEDDDERFINNADAGDNQTFAIKYKATPGYSYAPGTYTTDVIFTLTEH